MSDLIAIVYPTEAKAEEVRQRVLELQKEYIIKLGDAVIATKTEAGKGQVESAHKHDRHRCGVGKFLGDADRPYLREPAGWTCPRGYFRRAAAPLMDVGINDAFMKELSASIQPGNAALFLLVQEIDGRQGPQGDQGLWRSRAQDVTG